MHVASKGFWEMWVLVLVCYIPDRQAGRDFGWELAVPALSINTNLNFTETMPLEDVSQSLCTLTQIHCQSMILSLYFLICKIWLKIHS